MKRILILAFDFPPYPSIGGQRPYSWFRHLHEQGIHPTVITRHWDEGLHSAEARTFSSKEQQTHTEDLPHGRLIRVPYRANLRDRLIARYGLNRFNVLRKLLSLLYHLGQYASFRLDSLAPLYRAAEQELRQQPFEAIVATGEPFVLFRHAALLSEKYRVPWVADYRDGWSTIAHISYYTPLERFLLRHVFRRIERHYLRHVRLITTAAENYRTDLQQLHPHAPVEVVYNGFDEDLAVPAVPAAAEPPDFFKVTYAGTLYPYQPIELVLEGISLFCQRFPTANFKVFFYGMRFNPAQQQRVEAGSTAAVRPHLIFTEKLAKGVFYQQAANSHVFLLLGHPSVKALAGKLFDYFWLEREILFAVPDGGPQEELLRACHVGLFCQNAEQVGQYLSTLYEKWQAGASLRCKGQHYAQFSRKRQAQQFAELLKTLTP